ncbi:protein RALF-like 24 [Mercurialis annua]|uniref:protein RALF-like 24 n=1 Tax=Mercurialis annua TaxID=3986 RepID=UPI00215E71B4|nr:protein RALF-like 24 [Mercurialis annua]
MLKPTFPLLLILLLHTHFTISHQISVSTLKNSDVDSILSPRACSNTIGDCLEEPELMESEISRRVLVMQKKYISYETLKRDMVPCDKPGASYYDCHAGQANPYSRGCEMITRCRGH